MKNGRYRFLDLGLILIVAASSAAHADTCGNLQSQLNSCNANLANISQQIANATSDVNNQTNQVAALVQIRDTSLPACAQQNDRLAEQVSGAQDKDRHEDRERDQAARQNQGVTDQYNRLYQQKFVKWSCAIKDRKYANVGYGEGPSLEVARSAAITNGNIGKQVKDAGSYDFCFEIFRD